MADDLERLAGLVRIKNSADAAIGELIGRPSAPGNIGEFVASAVFAIQLMKSGSHPGHGHQRPESGLGGGPGLPAAAGVPAGALRDPACPAGTLLTSST